MGIGTGFEWTWMIGYTGVEKAEIKRDVEFDLIYRYPPIMQYGTGVTL